MALLQARYAANAYAFFEQVRDAAGFNAGRTADAVAMSLWPSRGLHLHGFEVKVSRTDWVRELKNPAKAESVNRYCDFWWLVVNDAALVKEGELPDTWGLLAVKKDELRLVRAAPKLTPVLLDRDFLACLLRRAYEARPAAKDLVAAEERGKAAALQIRAWERDSLRGDLNELQDKVKKFEAASGVQISAAWSLDNIGAAVRMVMKGEHLHAVQELDRVEASLGRALAAVREEKDRLAPRPEVLAS